MGFFWITISVIITLIIVATHMDLVYNAKWTWQWWLNLNHCHHILRSLGFNHKIYDIFFVPRLTIQFYLCMVSWCFVGIRLWNTNIELNINVMMVGNDKAYRYWSIKSLVEQCYFPNSLSILFKWATCVNSILIVYQAGWWKWL